jgi:acetolactate synthase-1/2/3 large subunit
VKLILMNNASLGLVVQQQNLFYGKRIFASSFKGEPDFMKIAEGFGWSAVDLDASEDPRRTLAEALAAPGPMFIHASIDRHEQVFPMVAPGAANIEMIGD